MLRVSSYNIFICTDEKTEEYLLIHGYTGALDIVSKDIYQIILKGEQETSALQELEEEDLSILKSRGYITEKTFEEEVEVFRSVAEAISKQDSSGTAITLIPSYDCNFRCSYCAEKKLKTNGQKWFEKRMEKNTVNAVFKHFDAARQGGECIGSIILYGGEPLLPENYDIIEYIVEECGERNIPVSCITNGYHTENFEALLKEGKIKAVQITLDGPEPVHNARRYLTQKKPTFSKIVENIEKYLELGIQVTVRTNVDAKNISTLNELNQFFYDRGWTAKPNFSNYFKSVHACYISNDEEKINELNIIKNLNENYLSGSKLYYNSIYSTILQKFEGIFNNKGYAPLTTAFCGASRNMLVIDPYEYIYTCWDATGIEENIVGKIDDDGKLTFNDNYSYWRDRRVQNMKECSKCAYALFCGGGCPSFAKVSNGDIYTSYCDYYKEIFNEAAAHVYKKHAVNL